jgi:hypothetical protein
MNTVEIVPTNFAFRARVHITNTRIAVYLYDERNQVREWPTYGEALAWLRDNNPGLRSNDSGGWYIATTPEKRSEPAKPEAEQLSMFGGAK